MNVEKTGELAPHGLRYDPPKWEDVMDLASKAAVEGVERSKNIGETSKLLIALRHLLEHSYRPVFEIEKTPRDKRSVQEQDDIFRLNHYYRCVKSLLDEGEEAWRGFNHDGWDLNLWKSRRRQEAEWEEAKATLPPALQGSRAQVECLLRPQQKRNESASEDWRQKRQRTEPGPELTTKKLKDVDEQHAERGGPREKQLVEDRKLYYMSYEERVKCREAKRKKDEAARRKAVKTAAKKVKTLTRVSAK